jgi:hypothetical protein
MFVTKNYVFKHDNLTKKYNNKKYRITSVLKVETDIIPSITVSRGIQNCSVSFYWQSDHFLMSHGLIIFSIFSPYILKISFSEISEKLLFYQWCQNVFDFTLTNNFQYQSVFRMRVTNNLAVREEYYNTCHQERISCIWNTRPDARACRIHQDFSLQLSCRMSYWCNNLQTIIYIKYRVLNIHGVLNIAYMEIGLGLWCLTPLSTIFQ